MQPAKCNRPLGRRLACSALFGFFLLVSVGQQKLWSKAQSHDDEAELKISLSAATISDILRREPGLLLEVKRVLVRKAYATGDGERQDQALARLRSCEIFRESAGAERRRKILGTTRSNVAAAKSNVNGG